MASLDALDQHDIDIHEYREQILQQSMDAVFLYTGNSEVEVDPVDAQLQNVFDKLIALLLPIVFPLFDTVPEMLAALDGYNAAANKFLDFDDHVKYLHFLTAVDHAGKKYRYLLDSIGARAHLSELNCETNEHIVLQEYMLKFNHSFDLVLWKKKQPPLEYAGFQITMLTRSCKQSTQLQYDCFGGIITKTASYLLFE